MSDLLGIGSSGVFSYQRALATVSNNIANVGTDGYNRQDSTIVSNQPRQVGSNYFGTGSRFDGVKRQFDAFLESNLRNSQSDLSSQGPMLSYVNRLINVMADQNIGLSSAMNRFFESARDLATNPASLIERNIFLRDADGVASRFRELSSQLQLLQDETRQAAESKVASLNSFAQQIAQVNRQLSRQPSESKQPPELLDQRDLLLRELSKVTGIKTSFEVNGQVNVSLGQSMNASLLVEGQKAMMVGISEGVPGDTTLRFQLDPFGTPTALPSFASGELGGILRFREQVLGGAQTSLDQLAKTLAQEVNTIHTGGIDLEGKPGQDLFITKDGKDFNAKNIELGITDSFRVAAGSLFRIINKPDNISVGRAAISYTPPSFDGPSRLVDKLAQSLKPEWSGANLTINNQGFVSLGAIPQGTTDLTLDVLTPNTRLHVMTRDGRHLIGSPLETLGPSLMTVQNGFEQGATYSAGSLSGDGAKYLDLDLFYGAKAEVKQLIEYDEAGKLLPTKFLPAELVSTTQNLGTVAGFAQDTLVLNGQVMPAFAGGNAAALVNWFNTQSDKTKVQASLSSEGALILRALDNTTEVRLGLGAQGTPDNLAGLGFNNRLHLKGAAVDDLLVFATGTVNQSVQLAGQYASINANPVETLRQQNIEVRFTSATTFELYEKNSKTLLAERSFNPNDLNTPISFRGLEIRFSQPPQKGDVFTIDANRDGIGNNEAMLRIVNLEKTPVIGGLTLNDFYIERVNQVGNVARQTTISQQAMQVVFDQAREARDAVSGVSLDEEAAALVRFQQAYQANARVMQMASTLFEAILQVR